MIQNTDVVIVGAGQAGLAMSRILSTLGIDHVVIERGRIGERWRSERWPSLRLLTPNWMNRLPGHDPTLEDPDDFLPARAFADLLQAYAVEGSGHICTETDVLSVSPNAGGFDVITTAGSWRARNVVVATGACDRPHIPGWANELPRTVEQVTPDRYRGPAELPSGAVLVVGASATGVQLAQELSHSGRNVAIATGRHVRTPRQYRGKDIFHWLDATGFLRDPRTPTASPGVSTAPSFQLIGDAGAPSPSLDRLIAAGVRVLGRAVAASGSTVAFADDLAAQWAASEARRSRVLQRIDAWIDTMGEPAPTDSGAWASTAPPIDPPREMNLQVEGVRVVVWATGYRRAYPWLKAPVVGADGEIANRGGVTEAPGLFVLGLPFMRHRASALIEGVGRDAASLARVIAARINARLPAAA